jgi:hypothetical protein
MTATAALAPIAIPEGISWRCLVELMMRRQKMERQPEIIRAVRRGNKAVYWIRGEKAVWPIVVKTVDVVPCKLSL